MCKTFFFFLLYVKCALSANILFVSPIPSPSHHIWNRVLTFGLANKGHNVTLIGPDKDNVKPSNYSHIYLEGLYEEFHDMNDMNEMAEYSSARMMTEFVDMCVGVSKIIVKSQGLQTLLNYPPNFKFDLIIFDVTMGSTLYPLIQRFNYPPAIGVTAFLLPSYVSYNFGNHLHPSYIPWYGLPYTSEMSFTERLWNFIFTYSEVAARYIKQYKEEHEETKKVFGEDIAHMEEFERNISLVLTNTDPLLDIPQPLPPNFIAVGGLHTSKPKQIPPDFQTILDGAKSGVIIFSLGSNVRSDKLDKTTQKALLDAFSRISETVIWKFESDIENLPKNVIVRKWLPQNDILSHPKVKLFIGHGGALSTQEAIFHGVPIICVPFFMDQHVNTKNIVGRKLGIFLDFRLITTDYVLEKINEILRNPLYSENVRRVSNTFRDRKETPLERAVFWVEYAIRHGGGDFLSTPGRDLPFYKSSGLDILAFLTLTCMAICVVLYKMVKMIFSQFDHKKKIKIN